MSRSSVPRALTIAGSDSGGGAGIQADLKTFAALGAYGMSVVTALTAQNTLGVRGISNVDPAFVALQLDAIAEDIGIDAAKTGMLSNAAIIEVVAGRLRAHNITNLIVDPVMVAKSGDTLLQADACQAMRELLLPLALCVTPNIPEAEVLSGIPYSDATSLDRIAAAILALGPSYVLLKGGHLPTPDATDRLYGPDGCNAYAAPRIQTRNTHGTGCTYSAAIAAYLAKGLPLQEAVAAAKDYLHNAILHSLDLGAGHGPLDHAWKERK